MQAQKCLRKEYHAFLAHIAETCREVKDVQNLHEVRDFPDTLPEGLPRQPPQRQVEFIIDLVPGVTPVAKSAYRLAPTEMQELPSEPNKLLKRGFFRPSFSLGGAPDLFVNKKERSKRKVRLGHRTDIIPLKGDRRFCGER